MSIKQLWEGADSNSWMTRLDGRSKLCILFSVAILAITIDNPRTLFLLFSGTLLLHFAAKTSIYKWQVFALLLLLGLWGSMVSQALFFAQTPRTPLVMLISPDFPLLGTLTNGLFIYQEGILYGAIQGLRSSIMLSLGLLICWNSDPRQLLKALVAWHLSPQVAFMLVTALRFLPVLASETGEVITALRLRSNSKIDRQSTWRHLPYVVNPLLARCLRRAQTLALSVVSRGFFLTSNKKTYDWPQKELIMCSIIVLVVVLTVSSKIVYLASEQGYYVGALRYIYDWTKLYL
ncbi:MAG: energy-coupling factor transporter transmembrane component T [Acidaminococcaceae bacterium]